MRLRILLPLLSVAILAGCSDYGDDALDGPTTPPAETVSFAADVQPIFETNCVGCHGDGGNAGLDLRSGQSYTNLVQIPATESALARVEPDQPLQSWLYLKLTGQQNVGDAMPPSSPLDTAITDVVRTWIEEGALDN